MNKLNVLDMFCGCGGLSKGFLDAGCRIVLGTDNDLAALKTFEKNHDGSHSSAIDLSERDFNKKIDEIISDTKIDIIVAGPPCQGFSLTGPRNFDDKRNRLYMSVIKAVEIYSPKAFVIENVPGMATLYKGQVKDEIIRRLEVLGYSVKCDILCAADYGVPQIRKRLFFCGIRKEYGTFTFPEPYLMPENYITCSDAISDLPNRQTEHGKEIDDYDTAPSSEYQRAMRGYFLKLYNHVATAHTQLVKDIISLVPEGENYKSLPPGIGDNRKFNEAWTRYHSLRPSKTIDTGHRNHFHYKYNRVPTIRENARLQSFPDDFIFYGTRTQQNKQVGNAVPPLLGKAIAVQILSLINSKENK